MAIINFNSISGVTTISVASSITVGNNVSIGTDRVTATSFTGNLSGNVTGTVNSSGIATFSSGVVVSAGSTSAPSISPSGDSNTGIFFPSADTIAFAEGGVEAARINSSGRFLIGTTDDASTTLNVRGIISSSNSLFTYSTLDGYTDGNLYITANAGQANTTNSNIIFRNSTSGGTVTEYARISNSGNLGIGTNNPSAVLDVESNNASGYIAEFRQKNTSNSAQIIIDSPSNGTSRPVLIDLARAGTVQWSIGQGYNASNDRFIFATSSLKDGTAGEQIAISTTGNILLKSGAGIDFSASSNAAGATSELLDDYETGTFTPVLRGSTTAGTTTANGFGRYTKIGNTVFITIRFNNVTISGGSGQILITGLPFTPNNTSSNTPVANTQVYNVTMNTGVMFGFYAATDGLRGLVSRSAATWVDWDYSNWTTAGIYANISITYDV